MYEQIIDEYTGEFLPILKHTLEDGTIEYIPMDPNNKDYQSYLTNVDSSDTIDE